MKKKSVLIPISILIILVLIVGGYYIFTNNNQNSQKAGIPAASAPTGAPEAISTLPKKIRIGLESPKTGKTLFVNAANTKSGDGSSWNNAFNSLQDALTASKANDEIWVVKGTYFPSTNDTKKSFTMKDDVSVYGGFIGTEKTREERDWKKNLTVLSGEIGDKKETKDNSYHVVIAANNILDGFTIRDGNLPLGSQGAPSGPPSGPPPGGPGGPPPGGPGGPPPGGPGAPPPGGPGGPPPGGPGAPPSGGPELGHITTEMVLAGDASTSMSGAGILIWQSAPIIKNCTISNNSAGKGGGAYVQNTSKLEYMPAFINCMISDNYAVGRGGGVSLDFSSEAAFIDCVFMNNKCDSKGGAIYNDFTCNPLFENCLFVNNTAEGGAGIANDGNSNSRISNTTFYGNVASESGAALYQGTGMFNDPIVMNSIIWNNTCDADVRSVYNYNDCNPKIDYSLIQDGYLGEGIIDTDPLFVDAKTMNFDFQKNSPCLTASNTKGRIGFNASLINTRKDSDYSKLVENMYSMKGNTQSPPTEILNPVTAKDIGKVGNVIYVKQDSKGDGSSWKSAFGSIQDAINYANAKFVQSGKNVEVWVAGGTYYPGTTRQDSYILQQGVSLYGGFSGAETKKDERDFKKNITILSGDIGAKGDKSDNSYHVLIGSHNAILDGFTISDGNADKKDGGKIYDNKGGGLYLGGRIIPPYVTAAHIITIKNCIFKDNEAIEGGAIYNFIGCNPVVENCEFINNKAESGGALVDKFGLNSKFTNCSFVGNTAKYKGGVSYIDYGSMLSFRSCKFENNTSGSSGGAIYLIDRASQASGNNTDIKLIDPTWTILNDIFSSVLIENSTFTNNKAGTSGGAIYAYEGSNVKIVSTNFNSNTAKQKGGAIALILKAKLYQDSNSTFSNNLPMDIYNSTDSKIIK